MNEQPLLDSALQQTPPQSHRPAVWATTALATGILVDHFFNVEFSVWFIILLTTTLLGVACVRYRRFTLLQSLTILVALTALGGARHQSTMTMRDPTHVLRFVTSEPAPARFIGVIQSDIDLINAEFGPRIPSWMEVDTSRFQLRCEQLADEQRWLPVSGVLRVDVSGHLVHARIGDRVEILGQLASPSPVKNPGGFDFNRYLQRQGLAAVLRVNHPQAVRCIDDSSPWKWSIARMRQKIRGEIHSLFVQHLSRPSTAVALSLIVGDRSQLNDELRDDFTQSGTMHLLAISGLHVGILAGLLAVTSRVFRLSDRKATIAIISIVMLYAFLTNHRPPVLRAAMVISIGLIGLVSHRRVNGTNLLAVCAGALLLWKPGDLFDIGAQLSFLAVGAILWVITTNPAQPFREKKTGLPTSERWRFLDRLQPISEYLFQGYRVTAAIWIATLPLTIATFHLVAPIGFLLNIFLIPYVAVSLSFGFLFVIVGLFLPTMAIPLGVAFDWSMQQLLGIVDTAQQLPGAHFYCSGLPTWWLTGYYTCMAIAWGLYGFDQQRRLGWRLLLLWLLVGGLQSWSVPQRDGLRYTALSVGHGLATVLELPSGETILYDAGTFGNGRRAERTVEQYLWSRGITRIDAVVISHADHDHFSGIFGLLERFSIGTLIVSQTFLDFDQLAVRDLCEAAAKKKIPIRLVRAGHLLETNSSASLTQIDVLHPAADFHAPEDNANSITLAVTYANRKLLLTGDLEKDGLEAVMKHPIGKCDVLMVPHHGSQNSNPGMVAKWSNPLHMIVSTGDKNVEQRLKSEVDDTILVHSTENSGAITVTITPQGLLRVVPFMNTETVSTNVAGNFPEAGKF